VAVGYVWGRSFIRPIFELMRGTNAVGEGQLDERVNITSKDEFKQLGDAFNSMADKLVELTEGRAKERSAGDVRPHGGGASFTILSHPVQNIGQQLQADRAGLRRPGIPPDVHCEPIDREIDTLKRVLDDLRNGRAAGRRRALPARPSTGYGRPTSSNRCAGYAEESGFAPSSRDSRPSPGIIEGRRVRARARLSLPDSPTPFKRPPGRRAASSSSTGPRSRQSVK
jgi:HAMP domain-containing protein